MSSRFLIKGMPRRVMSHPWVQLELYRWVHFELYPRTQEPDISGGHGPGGRVPQTCQESGTGNLLREHRNLTFLGDTVRVAVSPKRVRNLARLLIKGVFLFFSFFVLSRQPFAKSLQHPKVFPRGPPPRYLPGPHRLNFRVQMGSGVFLKVWP